MVEAAGIEIYRDANETERLLHIQELGVPGDVVNDFPFIVFYRIDEARRTVVIVALAPTSKEPGYWRGR